MRMQTLADLSGLRKQTIHYYLRKGYLDPPVHKEGNQASYNDSHLEKLLFIKKCRSEGIPLASSVRLWERQDRKTKASKTSGIITTSPTKEKIVEVATKTFLQKGFQQTRLSEISNSIGITQTSLYYYFKNKKDLYFACLDNIFKAYFEDHVKEITQETDPMKRLEVRWRITRAYFPEIITIFQLVKESLRDEDQDLRIKTVEKLRKSVIEPLAKDMDYGINADIFNNIGGEMMAFIIISLIEAIAYRSIFSRDYSDDELQRVLLDFIFFGLAKDPSKPPRQGIISAHIAL